MADPFTIAAVAAGVGGATQAAGSILSSRERSRAAAFEAQNQELRARELKIQSQQYKTAAAQAEAERRNELTSSLETAAAIRAGRGVGDISPSSTAIFEAAIREESANVRTERLNYLTQAEQTKIAAGQASTSARLARRKARTSLLAGYLEAGTAVAGSVNKIAGAAA